MQNINGERKNKNELELLWSTDIETGLSLYLYE